VWLQGLTARRGDRGLSETVDSLISSARLQGTHARATARSVVGTIDISSDDPELELADATVRELFNRSLRRPFVVKERRPRAAGRRAKRG
jgi:hypothetical protein